MKYKEFTTYAEMTNFKQSQWFLLWRAWRFEKAVYTIDVLKEYLAINPKVKNVKEMFRPERTNIGVIFQKYRKMRTVTTEGIADKLYNMKRIFDNCDLEHDNNDLEIIHFPLVFIRCKECFRTVKTLRSEGVWNCICGEYWIDPFYNIETIQKVWDKEYKFTPSENIKKLEEHIEGELPF